METVIPDLAEEVAALWAHQTRSFLEYIVEVSNPVPVTEVDAEILGLLRELHQAESVLKERTLGLLVRLGRSPRPRSFPMFTSAYNFMRPEALLRTLRQLARQDLEEVTVLRRRHGQGQSLEERLLVQLLDETLALRKRGVERMEQLLGEGGVSPAAPETPVEPPSQSVAAEEVPAPPPAEEGPPWHDESLSLEERMARAKGRGIFEQLYAAMAQTDCTACGYDCEGYARAIAEGAESDLSKCSPGELETQEMLETIMGRR